MNEIQTKEYFEALIKEKELRTEQRFKMMQIAIDKTEESMLARMETMNEFRAQINKERGEYVTKESLNLILQRLEDRKRSGTEWLIMLGVASIPIIIAIIAFARTF